MLTVSLNTLPHDGTVTMQGRPAPPFASFTPDYQLLYGLAAKYAAITCFVIIGDTLGFKALYVALAKYHTTKKVAIVERLDPEYIGYVRQKFRPEDTIVIAIAKDGDDPLVIQGLLAFHEYRKILITGEGALLQYARMKELELVRYPAIDPRFTIGTEAALLPAAIIYVDVRSFVAGMQSVYHQCDPSRPMGENPALQLAASLFAAEKAGYHEVRVPLLTKPLAGTGQLLASLMAGPGQTFVVAEAPPLGRRCATVFLRVERASREVTIPPDIQGSGVQRISDFAGAKLSDAAAKRYDDDRMALDNAHLPSATITLDVLNPGTFGELIGFWHYVAVYAAWLRNLNQ